MIPKTASQVLAEATAAMVDLHDVTDLLTRLLRDGASSIGVDGIGLLVDDTDDSLELLVSTPLALEQLEPLQVGQYEGPCVDRFLSAVLMSSNVPSVSRL